MQGTETASGVVVNEDNALKVGAVFACVSRLSETIGSLPIILYENKGDGKTRARSKRLYQVLHDMPNPQMTAMTFKETLMTHCLLYGNAFAEIVRNSAGEVEELYPIMPYRVKIDTIKNKLSYLITLPDGKEKRLSDKQMFHLPWLTINGIEAYQPIALAKEIIGLAMATEGFSAKYFRNGTNVGGVVEHPNSLKDTAYARLKKSLSESYEGLGNAHRLLLLEEGMKFQKVVIPPNDSQMLESRKHQVEEVARFYNVPPHIIQDLSRATFSNIEEQGTYYAVHTIRPWAVRWEQAIFRCLLTEVERRKYFAELLFEALMRGNLESRYNAYATARQWGWLSVNEIRARENFNPIGDQGDVYLQPMNMVDVDKVEELMQPKELPEQIEEQKRSVETQEERDFKSALNRTKLAQSFKEVFKDAASRCLKREEADIMRQARKTASPTALKAFISTFYDGHGEYLEKQISSPIRSLGMAIVETTKIETGRELILDDRYEKFLNDYIEAYKNKQIGRSRGQLLKIIDESEEEQLLEEMQGRFDSWQEKRVDEIAQEEVVQIGGAFARYAFAGMGAIALIWQNTGSKTCEFCEQLHGKVVGIDRPFLDKDEELSAQEGKMKVYGLKMNPPIHRACACTITPKF